LYKKGEAKNLPFLLRFVKNLTKSDLDVRRLNRFLVRLNRFFLTFWRFYGIIVLWRGEKPKAKIYIFKEIPMENIIEKSTYIERTPQALAAVARLKDELRAAATLRVTRWDDRSYIVSYEATSYETIARIEDGLAAYV
jgi:hypothetical protein